MIKSPVIIGKNCTIRKGAYIRENVIIGDDVIIGNSSEIKNSIILNRSQIPHFNYIGDSILGTDSHISAGAITSNFRLDGKSISVKVNEN
jgi:NDP-sugar pyrophosphorylase family protein